jgi:hypothetical protein
MSLPSGSSAPVSIVGWSARWQAAGTVPVWTFLAHAADGSDLFGVPTAAPGVRVTFVPELLLVARERRLAGCGSDGGSVAAKAPGYAS